VSHDISDVDLSIVEGQCHEFLLAEGTIEQAHQIVAVTLYGTFLGFIFTPKQVEDEGCNETQEKSQRRRSRKRNGSKTPYRLRERRPGGYDRDRPDGRPDPHRDDL
jgi:hypothetical protein